MLAPVMAIAWATIKHCAAVCAGDPCLIVMSDSFQGERAAMDLAPEADMATHPRQQALRLQVAPA